MVAMLVFTFIYIQITGISSSAREDRALEDFYELRTRINDLCFSISGSQRTMKTVLTENVEGIYLTRNKTSEIENIQEKVENNEISEGNTLCFKTKDQNPYCDNIDCNASMPYIGGLEPEFSIRSLIDDITGGTTTYRYDLLLKKDGGNVTIELLN